MKRTLARLRKRGHRQKSLPNSASSTMSRSVVGLLMLVGLGACSTTLADCFEKDATRLSTQGTPAYVAAGCSVTGTGPNGVATLVCEGNREGFMIPRNPE